MVTDSRQPTRVFLGSGGPTPRVDLMDLGAGCTRRLIDLPEGQSVYAIAPAPFQDDLALAATKGGLLYWLGQPDDLGAGEHTPAQGVNQGAPVLSACFITPSVVAVSDAVGRCSTWKRGNGAWPTPFETEGQIVCSLLKLDERTLVGLSTSGELLFWELPQGALLRTVPCPAPPRWSALVHLCHWPRAEALAYPGDKGQLVLFRLADDRAVCIAAHDGGFYAMLLLEESLITIGRQDGRLRRWQAGVDTPVVDLAAPTGAISCAALCDSPPELLIVRETGEAAVYAFGENELRLDYPIPGDDHRVVVGPPWDALKAALARRRADEVRQLVLQIRDGIERGSPEDIEPYHDRLVDLEYVHVSLALRAEQARSQEDTGKELKAYQDLVEVVPWDAPGTVHSLRRYAALLEEVWQLQEARTAWQHVAAFDVDANGNVKRLSPYLQAMAADGTVIEPEAPIPVILDAAVVLDRPISARFQVRSLSPLPCPGATVAPDQIVQQYDQIRSADARTTLPRAISARIWWVTRTGAEQIDVITFAGNEETGLSGLQFGLKVLPAGLQTVVVPVVLFDPGPGTSGREWTDAPLVFAELIGAKARSNAWLGRVHSAAHLALRRLVGETLSEQKRLRG